MIDPKGYFKALGSRRKPVYRRPPDPDSDSEEDKEFDADIEQEPNDLGGGGSWVDYNDVDPKKQPSLSNHHYFLLPSQIEGFILKGKLWSKQSNLPLWNNC